MLSVGLNPELLMDRYPHEISGGQRTRIALARVLILKPKILILDEVMASLDKMMQGKLKMLLNKLQQEYGFVYLFITHDMRLVEAMSDYVLVMKNGQMQEYGTLKDVFSNPQSLYTKQLIESSL